MKSPPDFTLVSAMLAYNIIRASSATTPAAMQAPTTTTVRDGPSACSGTGMLTGA